MASVAPIHRRTIHIEPLRVKSPCTCLWVLLVCLERVGKGIETRPLKHRCDPAACPRGKQQPCKDAVGSLDHDKPRAVYVRYASGLNGANFGWDHERAAELPAAFHLW